MGHASRARYPAFTGAFLHGAGVEQASVVALSVQILTVPTQVRAADANEARYSRVVLADEFVAMVLNMSIRGAGGRGQRGAQPHVPSELHEQENDWRRRMPRMKTWWASRRS